MLDKLPSVVNRTHLVKVAVLPRVRTHHIETIIENAMALAPRLASVVDQQL